MIISARLPKVALIKAPELGPRWRARWPVLSPMNAASGMTASAEKTKTGTAPHSSISAPNATGAEVNRIHFQ